MAAIALSKRPERDPIDLSGAHLRGLDFARTILRGANLAGANLTNANLQYADLGRANLSGARLQGANLVKADLRGAKLERADFSDADLSEAKLDDCDISNANLRNAKLDGCDLRRTTGISWYKILESHIGAETKLPSSLDPKELLNIVASSFSHFPWREKYAEHENELLSELISVQNKQGLRSLDDTIFGVNAWSLRTAEKNGEAARDGEPS